MLSHHSINIDENTQICRVQPLTQWCNKFFLWVNMRFAFYLLACICTYLHILYDYMYRYMHMLSDLGGLNGHTCSGGFKYMFILASISANISRSTYNTGINVNLCHQLTNNISFPAGKTWFYSQVSYCSIFQEKSNPFILLLLHVLANHGPILLLVTPPPPVFYCTIATPRFPCPQPPRPPPPPPLLLITCISHPHSSFFRSSLWTTSDTLLPITS